MISCLILYESFISKCRSFIDPGAIIVNKTLLSQMPKTLVHRKEMSSAVLHS